MLWRLIHLSISSPATLTGSYYLPVALAAAQQLLGVQSYKQHLPTHRLTSYLLRTNTSPPQLNDSVLETTSILHMMHHRFITSLNSCRQLTPIFTPFRQHFQHNENHKAVEIRAAGLTVRHLIFRLHSIKLGGSGQLMSTMTFQQHICQSGLRSRLTGRRGLESLARLEVVCCCMTGRFDCSFHLSPLRCTANYRHAAFVIQTGITHSLTGLAVIPHSQSPSFLSSFLLTVCWSCSPSLFFPSYFHTNIYSNPFGVLESTF